MRGAPPGGSGQIAASQGVANQVLAVRLKAKSLPFPDESFDAVISIGRFKMIGVKL